MALSPADFAAYSRATGTPYPEDPEERAQLAPEVASFRRDQLQAPKQESNLPGILGATALGLGALAGGVGLARALGRTKASVASSPQSDLTPKGRSDVAVVDRYARQRAAEDLTRQARSERPAGVVQADLSNVQVKRSLIPTEAEAIEQYSRRLSQDFPEPTASEMEALNAPSRTSKILARLGTSPQYRPDPKDINYPRFGPPSPEVAAARRQQASQDLLRFAQQRQEDAALVANQTMGALESGEDQMTGRTMMGVQRNEDLDASQVNNVARQTGSADVAASMTPDGVPVDQAENLTVRGLVSQGKPVLDVRQGQAVSISPRTLGQEEGETDIFREAQRYLRGREVDTDFDYSAENRAQTAQVRDRIQRAQALQSQADQIISELRGETQPQKQQLSSEDFAKQFNKQYREEVNPELRMVDNARQRAELLASRAESTGQDLESLLLGESSPVDENMRGGALRGGKINAAGDIVYQDAAGAFASADTGLKTRQAQGQQFEERARRLNQLRAASDEDLTYLVAQGQQSLANKEPLSRLDVDTYRFASQVLRDRAINNPEPTPLQLDALDRARASVAASQQALQSARNQRPTLAPGPQQDVARSMETLRRGMAVEPSEPLPVIPSVQELRTGYVSDELGDIGPIVSAPDVYTGAAAEAAGPVIFTGKSKANTVLTTPPITGSVKTSTGRYLTQDNPDVLGTVYNVAGTPANRAISAQVEHNAQEFLQDAIAGGLQQKAVRVEEPYRTPGTYGVQQLNLLTPPLTEKGLSQNQLGLPGLEASQRTGYAQYQPGRSRPAPISPFTGEMAGGTVVVVPPTGTSTGSRRDIGAPSASIDLTRRGEKSRYFPRYPEEQFVTGMEPAPIGPVLQSPGLSRIGGMAQQTVQGAGGIPITQLTPQGQKISYPRMDKPVTVPGYGTSVVTNVPRYGINPGAEDWRDDLMRSAFRRGGPIRTYQG
jgi:hypothetical protein